MRGIHVYAHVPFCIDTCGYCDFYRGPYQLAKEKIYLQALTAEIDQRIPEGSRIDSLYFGGGTPSLLTETGWLDIFRRFRNRSEFSSDAEISLEANPAGISKDSSGLWRSLGFNRVSVGVQSLNDQILKFLDRIHTSDTALNALKILSEDGWNTVSADLIYGIPSQSIDDCREAVEKISPLVQHLSTYALTLTPNTPLARSGIVLPPDDDVADQYECIVEMARGHGLEWYEISNFARDAHRCRHNLNTWRYRPYIGIGPSAAGFDGQRRYKNISDLRKYVKNLEEGHLPAGEEEIPDESTAFWDRVMLGLRTSEGVKLTEPESGRLKSAIGDSDLDNWFQWSGDGVKLQPERLILLDEILTRVQIRC